MKGKVLVIDDEDLIRSSLKKYLEKDGFEVSTAQSGEEGIEIFRTEPSDIVLLDLQMPGAGGLETLESFKKLSQDVIVIIITAHGDIDTAVTTIKRGAYDFIEKPFELNMLSLSIEKALETINHKKNNTPPSEDK